MENQPREFGNIGDFEELRRHWLLEVILGVALIVLGAIAISISAATSVATMVFLGWFLLIGGVIEGIHAFTHRRWHFFPDLLLATLYAVIGIIIIGNPVAAVLTFTLMIIAFFLVSGIFRIVAAVTDQFGNRWSMLASGIISLLLGILLWSGWPATAFWVIGMFVGIELILNGWSVIMFGMAARHVSGTEVPHPR